MFEKIKTKKLPFKAEQLPKVRTGNYKIPCLTSSFNNQGLNYFAPPENVTILKNVISIPSNSDVYRAYYQSNEFTVLSDAYAIRWAFTEDDLSPSQYLFAVQCINKVTDLRIYSYKSKLGGWNVVKEKHIKLPTKCGEIDFEFMENFIAELEAERIAEIEAYLEVTGLSDCELTEDEQKVLDDFTSDAVEWGEFSLKDLFSVNTSKKRFDANKVKISKDKNGSPYIVRQSTNNGRRGYIEESPEYLNENNTIAFGQDTATMFYQNEPYFTGDKIKILKPKFKEFNKDNAQFFLAAMEKSFSSFSWGSSSFSVEVIENQMVKVPTNNCNPNYSSMELLISAIQKIVVKDVVLYAEKKHNPIKK